LRGPHRLKAELREALAEPLDALGIRLVLPPLESRSSGRESAPPFHPGSHPDESGTSAATVQGRPSVQPILDPVQSNPGPAPRNPRLAQPNPSPVRWNPGRVQREPDPVRPNPLSEQPNPASVRSDSGLVNPHFPPFPTTFSSHSPEYHEVTKFSVFRFPLSTFSSLALNRNNSTGSFDLNAKARRRRDAAGGEPGCSQSPMSDRFRKGTMGSAASAPPRLCVSALNCN